MKNIFFVFGLMVASISFSQKYTVFPKGKAMSGINYSNYVQPSRYTGEFISNNGFSVVLRADGTGELIIRDFDDLSRNYSPCRCCMSGSSSIVWGVAYDGYSGIAVLCDMYYDQDTWYVKFDSYNNVVAIEKRFLDFGNVEFKRKK